MKFAVKFVSVVAASAAIGVALGLVIHSALARSSVVPDGAYPLRIAAEVGEAVPKFHGRSWHSCLQAPDVNEGDPGVLLVRGAYQVSEPDPLGAGNDHPFDVLVRVEDKFGHVIIDRDYLGSGIDKSGMGNWEQTFSAAYRLPAGKYVVEMLLHDPNKRFRNRDGTVVSPFRVGFYRTTMTVR